MPFKVYDGRPANAVLYLEDEEIEGCILSIEKGVIAFKSHEEPALVTYYPIHRIIKIEEYHD